MNNGFDFIELKDVSFAPTDLVAYGKITIPPTMQTPQMYALSIYLRGFNQPLIVTYEELEARDEEYGIIKQAVSK